VFIFQNRGAVSELTRGAPAFNSETWAAEGLRYFIIGDASASDIHALSELLKIAARS
jgi:hypothetical protein